MAQRFIAVIAYACVVTGFACSAESNESAVAQGATGRGDLSVDSAPLIDVGAEGAAGEPAVLQAGAGTRLSNGVIVVADVAARAIVFFDSSGRLLRKAGREGRGPGEFLSAGWVGRCHGDSLFVWDRLQNRITVLDSAGKFARDYRTPGNPATMRCSRSGRFAIFMMPRNFGRPDPTGKSPRYTAPLWIADEAGDTLTSLGELPVGETRPLGKVSRIAMADDRVYVGTADSAFVDVYSLDGKRLPTIRVGTPVRAPTQRNYEKAIDASVVGLLDRNTRDAARRYMLKIPMPERMPPYTALFADPRGTLWVVTSAPGDSATTLRAITPDNRILGDVHLPAGLRVLEVGQDYILGTYEDEDGEPHVAMYRLRRTGQVAQVPEP